MKFTPDYTGFDGASAPILSRELGTGASLNGGALGVIEHSILTETQKASIYQALLDPTVPQNPLLAALGTIPYNPAAQQAVQTALGQQLFGVGAVLTPPQQQLVAQLEPAVKYMHNVITPQVVATYFHNAANGNGIAVDPLIQAVVNTRPVPHAGVQYDQAHCQDAANEFCRNARLVVKAAHLHNNAFAQGLAQGLQQPQPPQQGHAHAYVQQHGRAIKGDIQTFLDSISNVIPHDPNNPQLKQEILGNIFGQLKNHDPNSGPFSLDDSKIPGLTNNQITRIEGIVDELSNYVTGQAVAGPFPDGANVRNGAGHGTAGGLDAAKKFATESFQALAGQEEARANNKEIEALKRRKKGLEDAYSLDAKAEAKAEVHQGKVDEKREDHSVSGGAKTGAKWGAGVGLLLGLVVTIATGGLGWPALFLCPMAGAAIGGVSGAAYNKYKKDDYKSEGKKDERAMVQARTSGHQKEEQLEQVRERLEDLGVSAPDKTPEIKNRAKQEVRTR